MQFHGEYQHRLDPQGRIAVPARYRDAFARGIYLTKGFDACIWVFTPSDWDTYSAAYAAMSPNSRLSRMLRRQVFGSTYDAELDRQGRIVIPQTLRAYANLREEVSIVGTGNMLELWDREQWERLIPEIEAAGADIGADDGEGA